MNKLIEKMFFNRRIANPVSYMKTIDNSEHSELLNADELASSLYNLYLSNKHIVVLPDFDMDGIMSGVVGFAGLSALGFYVSLFIPDPNDGYGFTPTTIDRLIFDYPDVDAIITCDVGISCIEGIDYAVSKGIDVYVTDHHTQSEASRSDNKALIIVDPMSIDDTYEHPQICGAHVFYQCLRLLAEKYYDSPYVDYIDNLRVFAGIGTVSDSMPLLYENRQLVRDAVDMCRLLYMDEAEFIYSMRYVNENYRQAFLGLYDTLSLFSEMGTISSVEDITEEFFGFYLAPMFNSVKRLGGDMRNAFGAFFGYKRRKCVEYLYELNEKRKALVTLELNAVLGRDQPYAPYIYISTAGSGVLGLLATKLLTMNGVPTVVVNEDDGKFIGSGRSVPWFNFLTNTRKEGFTVAGHELAFGITLNDINELKKLYDYLEREIHDILANTPSVAESKAVPDFVVALDGTGDTNIDPDLFREYLHELEYYRPFGTGFSPPMVSFKFRAVDGVWFVIGSTKQHLKIMLPYSLPILCFNQAEYFSYAKTDATIYVTGHFVINTFNGVSSVNFIGDIDRVEG